MQIVVGPVLTTQGGYAFDCWGRPSKGLARGIRTAESKTPIMQQGRD
jgi:hypothetical protein